MELRSKKSQARNASAIIQKAQIGIETQTDHLSRTKQLPKQNSRQNEIKVQFLDEHKEENELDDPYLLRAGSYDEQCQNQDEQCQNELYTIEDVQQQYQKNNRWEDPQYFTNSLHENRANTYSMISYRYRRDEKDKKTKFIKDFYYGTCYAICMRLILTCLHTILIYDEETKRHVMPDQVRFYPVVNGKPDIEQVFCAVNLQNLMKVNFPRYLKDQSKFAVKYKGRKYWDIAVVQVSKDLRIQPEKIQPIATEFLEGKKIDLIGFLEGNVCSTLNTTKLLNNAKQNGLIEYKLKISDGPSGSPFFINCKGELRLLGIHTGVWQTKNKDKTITIGNNMGLIILPQIADKIHQYVEWFQKIKTKQKRTRCKNQGDLLIEQSTLKYIT